METTAHGGEHHESGTHNSDVPWRPLYMKHTRDPKMEMHWWDPKWLAPAHADASVVELQWGTSRELRKIQSLDLPQIQVSVRFSYQHHQSKLGQNWNLKYCLGSQNQDHTLV